MDFADALYGGSKTNRESDNKQSVGRQALRKTQQFCRQVQRALNMALADCTAANQGSDVFVDEVSPGPDCGHLLVHIVVQDGYSIADAMSALRRDTSRLRSEVAMAISRKRAPELMFIPVSQAGGNDD
jgi:ribosome-binding factor A